MTTYVDTSALLKLLFLEGETAAVRDWFISGSPDELVSSHLVLPEAHCAARRREPELPGTSVDAVLSLLNIVDLLPVDLDTASRGNLRLRAADAIHLAVAQRVGADAMLVYDVELAAAARAEGLDVIAPA